MKETENKRKIWEKKKDEGICQMMLVATQKKIGKTSRLSYEQNDQRRWRDDDERDWNKDGDALWSRTAKNSDCSTGPLGCPLTHLLVPLICSYRSFVRSLAHFAHSLESE